jgi:hypothetical protein
MFMRYATLVTLAVISLYAVISASAHSGQVFLVGMGQTGSLPQNSSFWLLAGIATITGASLCRFVIFGIPSMLGGWYANNKQWLYTLVFGGLVCGVFYLM